MLDRPVRIGGGSNDVSHEDRRRHASSAAERSAALMGVLDRQCVWYPGWPAACLGAASLVHCNVSTISRSTCAQRIRMAAIHTSTVVRESCDTTRTIAVCISAGCERRSISRWVRCSRCTRKRPAGATPTRIPSTSRKPIWSTSLIRSPASARVYDSGAFYPPMSLENRATGWETPYTLTPSPISSWIGEEIRTIGLEGQVDWLGTRTGHSFDLQLTGALFGWNDPAGTMIALNGFVLDDRQTTSLRRASASRAPIRTEPKRRDVP